MCFLIPPSLLPSLPPSLPLTPPPSLPLPPSLSPSHSPSLPPASDLVSWLLKIGEAEDRAAGVRLGQLLVDTDYIHHVVDGHGFEDAFLFFRFRQDGKEDERGGGRKLDNPPPSFSFPPFLPTGSFPPSPSSSLPRAPITEPPRSLLCLPQGSGGVSHCSPLQEASDWLDSVLLHPQHREEGALPVQDWPGMSACLPACIPACLPASLPASLPACLHPCLPPCLPACIPACLPACSPWAVRTSTDQHNSPYRTPSQCCAGRWQGSKFNQLLLKEMENTFFG